MQPGSFGKFIVPNGRGVTVLTDGAEWPRHGVPSWIWMLAGPDVSSECAQVRLGQW